MEQLAPDASVEGQLLYDPCSGAATGHVRWHTCGASVPSVHEVEAPTGEYPESHAIWQVRPEGRVGGHWPMLPSSGGRTVQAAPHICFGVNCPKRHTIGPGGVSV
jgi:hypothetical protein